MKMKMTSKEHRLRAIMTCTIVCCFMVAYFMYVATGAWEVPPAIEIQDTEAQREWQAYMDWLAANKNKSVSFYEWQEIKNKEKTNVRKIK